MPQEAVEKAARAIEQGIKRDDSIWDLAQEALNAGFDDFSRELQHLRHADVDARVNRDTVIRAQDQLDAIEKYISPEQWYGGVQPRLFVPIQRILDGETGETAVEHTLVNLRQDPEGHWVGECTCGKFSSGSVDYAGNAVALVRKHAQGRHT